MRIVSLIPEATEILQAIGLEDLVVSLGYGGSAFLGGWDAAPFTTDALVDAHPTLIFTSETYAGAGLPRRFMRRLVTSQRHRMTTRPGIYTLEPHSLGDILSDIKTVGDATGRQDQARALIESLRARIDAVSLRTAVRLAEQPPRRVACVQRSEPPMAAGWWLAELIGLAGGLDVLDGVGRPPRPVTREQIRAAQPDLVIDLAPDEVVPVPQTVDVLERMLAQILHNTVGLRSEIGS